MFSYNGKSINNSEVQNIAITVELGEEFESNDWKTNERYTHEQLIKFKNVISMPIECPIDDLVYLQPEFSGQTDEGYYIATKEDFKLLGDAYSKIKETFKGKKIQISIHSDYISDEYNEIPMTLDEFLKLYTLD